MTQTTPKDAAAGATLSTLDIDAIRPDLQALAKATVDRTLQQARNTRADPVLGCSSTLATYCMMIPRNDGQALEQVLDIVARHVESLTVIRNGLRFSIDPKHLELLQSNHPVIFAGLQTNYDPAQLGPSYRADALAINQVTGKACLLEFKRQTATIETTKLNGIADNLAIAQAQVCDFLYKQHWRLKIEPQAVNWAIIDCSDQELPPRFRDAGVFGLNSLDDITGASGVAEAYRMFRKFMATEFRRGEAELMGESQRFISLQSAQAMIEAEVTRARLAVAAEMAQVSAPAHSADVDATNTDDPEDHAAKRPPSGHHADHTRRLEATIIPFPADRQVSRRRFGRPCHGKHRQPHETDAYSSII